MSLFTQLKQDALKALQNMPALEGAVITDEYPSVWKAESISKPVLAVGFRELSVLPSGFSGLIGKNRNGDEETGRRCKATFLFTLCAPKREVAKTLFDLFAALGGLLLPDSGFPVPVTGLTCDPVEFDRTLGCPVLRAYAQSEFLISDGGQESPDITDITVRSVVI